MYKAVEAVREIQVLEGPHIAEADDAVMTKLEQDMDGLRSASRAALGELTGLAGKGPPDEHLAAASGALARFEETHAQIIGLSRKNTNVRSLALSLGRKRTVITACDVSLAALQSSLAAEGLKATR